MNKPTDMGSNRTGIGRSPVDSKRTIEGAEEGTPDRMVDMHPDALHAERVKWSSRARPVGTMPPPSKLKGVAKTAIKVVQGKHPTVLLDLLGARLAFERSGTRLYEALLIKHEAASVHEGGPTRAELEENRDEEMEHAAILTRCIEELGADPTAVTPSADVQGVASQGVLSVVADPRTTLTQALDAVLIAELADNDAWKVLTDIAEGLGHSEMAAEFRRARSEEDEHLTRVRRWLSTALTGQAGIADTRALDPDEAPG
jgi:rubrerythrin